MAPGSDDMPDLDRPVTRRELREELAAMAAQLRTEFATKEEMATGFAEMREYVDFSWKSVRDELRGHFDLTAESFRSEFRHLYDWTLATTTSLATRVEALEKRHLSGSRRRSRAL
jgi:hypothetical protein